MMGKAELFWLWFTAWVTLVLAGYGLAELIVNFINFVNGTGV
jgi:hypothetical protein